MNIIFQSALNWTAKCVTSLWKWQILLWFFAALPTELLRQDPYDYNQYLLTYSVALQPWWAQAWFSVFEEQVANLLPQHRFESAWFNNQSHLVAKQENITGEKQDRKFCRQSISLMLCRVLLHAVNLRHGTDGFTSPLKEVRARDFYHT
jgi:hypothetical protein